MTDLIVVCDGTDERSVQRELEQRYPSQRLFLDKDLDERHGAIVYSVNLWRGDQEPALLMEWRDEYGRPRPLSTGLLMAFERLAAGAEEFAMKPGEINEQTKAEVNADTDYAISETFRDILPRLSGIRAPMLHRGPHLRRSRDKRRARGEHC